MRRLNVLDDKVKTVKKIKYQFVKRCRRNSGVYKYYLKLIQELSGPVLILDMNGNSGAEDSAKLVTLWARKFNKK